MKLWRLASRVFTFSIIFLLLGIAITNIWVVKSTEDQLLTSIDQVDANSVALVLGTSSKLSNGEKNPFFENRIKAAAQLYKSGKIAHFILSGDNLSSKYYNEPAEMQKALLKRGVPKKAITLDLAGLRTLDSIIRSKEIFGQEKILIITQPFHSYRALFISDFYHIQAKALGAKEPQNEISLKMKVREYLARTRAVIDLYIFNTAPQHLGKKEPLVI
jgi:SanA protein